MTATAPLPLDPTLPLAGRMRSVERAVVVPPWGPERPQICGAFDDAGRPVAESLCYGGSSIVPVTTVPATAPGEVPEVLAGTWLFGGVISGHFGHMLCEATGRLWALDHVPEAAGVLFFARPFDKPRPVKHGFARLAALLRVPKVVVVTAATRVERLVIPEQGLGSGELMNGRPESRAFLRDRLAGIVPAGEGRRLFLTRSGQPPRRGMLLDEAGLEPLFAAADYEVIRPEDLSLADQVAMLRAASHVVASEGSALHLAGFAVPSGCRVAVIRRRLGPIFDQICESIGWFVGHPPLALATHRSVHAPRRARNANLVYLEPSRPALRDKLVAAGFIAADTPDWPDLTDEARQRAVAELAAATGHPLFPVADDVALESEEPLE